MHSKIYYYVEVSYPLSERYPLEETDQRVRKAAGGKRPSDSGAGFGFRDLGWVYYQKPAQKRFVKRLHRNLPKRGFSIRVREYPKYEN